MSPQFKKGKYYQGLGKYIEIRTTYSPINKKTIKEHIFSTGEYDISGVVYLNRLKI